MLQRVTANHAGPSSTAIDLITVGASRKGLASHTHLFLLWSHFGFTLFGRLAIVLSHSVKGVQRAVYQVERQIEDSHGYVSIAGMGMPDLAISFFVCWLLNVPATRESISGTDLHRQFYVLPHWDRSCRSNFPSHPVTVYWHRADQSQCWPYNARRLAG